MRISDWSSDVCSSDLEQALRFPDFSMLDVSDKLAMGFGLVSESILDPHNLLVAAVVLMASALLVRAPIGKASKSLLFVVLGVLLLGHAAGALGAANAGAHGLYLLQHLDGAAASSSRAYRSEERRAGKECVSTCKSRCSPYH